LRYKLSELFEMADLTWEKGARDPIVSGITDDTRRIETGDVFVATAGATIDSHLFISDAVEKGAAAIIAEKPTGDYGKVPVIQVADSRDALGRLAHAYYGNPSRKMLVAAVTGTNGKTTSTFIIESILKAAGYNPGVIGTIEYRYAGKAIEAPNTTPSAIQLARMLAEMRDAGVNALVMEASSHAADQRRISGIEFDGCILTNITQDHLDYHRTMEAYAEAKKSIFTDYIQRRGTQPGKGAPVAAFNVDDEWGARFAADYKGNKLTYALQSDADLRATDIEMLGSNSRFRLHTDGATTDIGMNLVGMFNIYNALGSIALCKGLGISMEHVVAGLGSLDTVPGRLEQVRAGQNFMVLVDYAHTPDALERVLVNSREMTRGKLIVVFGCGGDRDPGKRPIMGKAAGELADYVVVTNDNPRTEDPEKIADQVMAGVRESERPTDAVQRILDRKGAIHHALGVAQEGDVVVIAGKGHEDYQILGREKVHFDDREVAREFLQARGVGANQ